MLMVQKHKQKQSTWLRLVSKKQKQPGSIAAWHGDMAKK